MNLKFWGKSEKTDSQGAISDQGVSPEVGLAIAYVRPQEYGRMFAPEEALARGTLWPALYVPYSCGESSSRIKTKFGEKEGFPP